MRLQIQSINGTGYGKSGQGNQPVDIDRASGTYAWLLHLLPGDKSPGYKIARSDAASC
jgi:hypothetical protein